MRGGEKSSNKESDGELIKVNQHEGQITGTSRRTEERDC